jgi:sulfane dehydrogenase subunit SoxC
LLQSRAVDETGYVQPAREVLLDARGVNAYYHFNAVQTWRIAQGGAITNAV